MATLGDAISLAKNRLGGAGFVGLAWADADLLVYANNALKAMCELRPELFYAIGELTCINGETTQTFPVTESAGLVDVLGVKNGNAVRKAEKSLLDRLMPSWRATPAAAATSWMPAADDLNRIYIHPKSPANQVLVVHYIRPPPSYALDDTHNLPAIYTPTIATYIMAMSYHRDGDKNGQAEAMAEFSAMLGASTRLEKDSKEIA